MQAILEKPSALENQSVLEKLLEPYSLEKFLSENWTKQGIHIPGDRPNKFQSYFSWKQLNELLNSRCRNVRFVLDQKPQSYEPKDWVKKCREGATLVVDQVQNHVQSLGDLTWDLQQELGYKTVHTNIYCSWPDLQGFKTHYDTHEVFVLQIDGQKEWFVFDDTTKYPYREEKHSLFKPPTSNPYIHTVLNPGDLLYIPRGHWHHAIAREKPSLHVTLGVDYPTGKDVLVWMLNKLNETTLKNEEQLRQGLPIAHYGESHNFETHVRKIFDSLSNNLDCKKEQLVQEYLQARFKFTFHMPEISLPGQMGFNIFKQGIKTVLRQPKYLTIKLERPDENTYVLVTNHKTLKFKDLDPNVIETILNYVLSQDIFTIQDIVQSLPNCDLETVIYPFLGGLVKEGILVEEQS